MDKLLNTSVSVYQSASDTQNRKTVSLGAWIRGWDSLNKLVDAIRNEPDKIKRSELKKQLPGITASGVFSYRNDQGLEKHSGYIALDFDNCDPIETKHILSQISNVSYAGLSASGQGVWALIPIVNTEYHRQHFKALETEFRTRFNLEVDKSCINVSRLRFYSYDNDPHIYPDAIPFSPIAPEKEESATYEPTKTKGDTPQDQIFERLLDKIELTRTDLTSSYDQWFMMGCAIAENFGENGRDYYHRLSRFYHNYCPDETNRQFDKCKKRNHKNTGLGLIFQEAANKNIYLKN